MRVGMFQECGGDRVVKAAGDMKAPQRFERLPSIFRIHRHAPQIGIDRGIAAGGQQQPGLISEPAVRGFQKAHQFGAGEVVQVDFRCGLVPSAISL